MFKYTLEWLTITLQGVTLGMIINSYTKSSNSREDILKNRINSLDEQSYDNNNRINYLQNKIKSIETQSNKNYDKINSLENKVKSIEKTNDNVNKY